MLARVRHVAAPPIFEDEHQNRTAQLLNAFLLFAITLSILGVLILPFVITEMLLPFMGLFGGAALIYLGCLVMLRRCHLWAASVVFIATYWMVQNLAVGINGGMTSPSILNYSTSILIAGFLLGLRASIVMAGLTILFGAGFVYADAIGILGPPVNPITQSIGWATLSFNLVALAVIQHWATRSLSQTLDRARRSEGTLAERSRELERESGERERTEEAYRVLVEQSLQGLFIVQDNRIVFANSELCRMLGYSAEELYALEDPGTLLHPQDRAMVLGNMARRLAGESVPPRYECRVLHKSGQGLWLEIFSSRTTYRGTYAVQVAAIEITERKRAEVALRTSEERYRLISELISDYAYCYYVNPDGTWRMEWLIGSPIALTGYDASELSGSLRIYHPEDDERARQEVEQALQGQPTEGDFRIITRDGHMRWIHTRRQPIWDSDENRFARFYAAVHDVTDRKLVEEELRHTLELRRQFLEQLKELHEVGLELSRAETLDDLCRRAVDLGRSRLGFDRIGVWFLDSSDPDYMVGSYGTDEDGVVRDESTRRVKMTIGADMREILDGRVFITTSEDAIIRDDQSQAVGHGWNAATKLRVGDRHTGWLFIDNLLKHEPQSDYQLELLALYAAAISHLATAKSTLEELRHTLELGRQFLEQLKMLHEVGLELSRAETLDDLCRHAVDLGRSKLGFDRLGLWFLDSSDPDYAIGSYGTDEDGFVKGEHSVRIHGNIGGDMDEILDGRVLITSSDDAPLRGNQSQVVGNGWNAVAKVRFGNKHTGWLFIDNLLRREPRSSYQLELLALYAATIGHLATAKSTLEELRYSESHLQQAIHIARLGIWEWETRTDTTIWSDAMYDMYGISPEEFTGRGEDYLKMTHPDDQDEQRENIRTAFERAGAEIGEPRFASEPGEYRIVRPDGTIRSLVGDAVAIVDQDGRPVRMMGILMDVTDRKNAEKQALELALVREREENLREFISTISHDLKTPLSVINTSLYLLERITDPEHHKDKVQTIKAQAQLLEKYIQDILTISRLDHIPHMTHQPVSLNRSLDEIVRRLHISIEQKNLTTTLDLDDKITAVLGDENEINRALVNLIENAMNYTPPNGSIVIQTSLEGDSVVAAITDTGIGISESDLPHIFERFYRASAAQEFEERGTGLGLAIVKRIVELHHGSIDVQSTVGQGTSFRIRFPLLPNSAN